MLRNVYVRYDGNARLLPVTGSGSIVNFWRKILLSIFDGKFYCQFLTENSIVNFWPKILLSIFDGKFYCQFLTENSIVYFWRKSLLSIFDGKFYCQFSFDKTTKIHIQHKQYSASLILPAILTSHVDEIHTVTMKHIADFKNNWRNIRLYLQVHANIISFKNTKKITVYNPYPFDKTTSNVWLDSNISAWKFQNDFRQLSSSRVKCSNFACGQCAAISGHNNPAGSIITSYSFSSHIFAKCEKVISSRPYLFSWKQKGKRLVRRLFFKNLRCVGWHLKNIKHFIP